MSDRRRAPRYELVEPLTGDAMPMQDVMIETFSGDRLVVISHSNPAHDEPLMVHIVMPQGLVSRHAAVVSSHPVSVAGSFSFRVELRVGGPAPASPEIRKP